MDFFTAIGVCLFGVSATFGFVRGRGIGVWGKRLRWPFYVWPFVSALALAVGLFWMGGDVWLDVVDPAERAFAYLVIACSALLAVPYVGAGIGGFYVGRIVKARVDDET